ncbi:MAG TPA: hypothetical protein VM100_14030 [Longimicrobiales bacterium]|nr:hypothetical protein [Longimicrobiales bacterium]
MSLNPYIDMAKTLTGGITVPVTPARPLRFNGAQSIRRRLTHWLAAMLTSVWTLCAAPPAIAAPDYMTYWGLAWNIREVQDHVNLYWAVSWDWEQSEVLEELMDAKARGMRAVVHVEFAFFIGSGQYANSCPYTPRSDAAGRWDAFVQALSRQGLLDTVVAFYPVDEPDLCGVTQSTVLSVINIIRAHPLTAGKPVAGLFTCDVAKKFGGPYRSRGDEHQYGQALRAYDWVGFDCYGSNDIFTEPAWTTVEFNIGCLCFIRTPGPSYYDNFKLQLTPAQRITLVPQGFVAGDNPVPDDPQTFANRAAADPAVILLAPFTWFDQLYATGVRSQPELAQQWRTVGRAISLANPPNANPPLPPAPQPRLRTGGSDVAHLSVNDVDCNATTGTTCALQVWWQLTNMTIGTQLFRRIGASPPELVTCMAAKSYVDVPDVSVGVSYSYDLYQTNTCASTVPGVAKPIATVNILLLPSESGGVATIVEYYNASLDHYFITWMPNEIAKLDAGTVIKGWARTGKTFKTYTSAQSGTSPVCRFYIPPGWGDSHFFGRGTVECNATGANNPSFVLEDPAFMQMVLPNAGVCPANTVPIYRVFDNRIDANHRYMTDIAVRNQMVTTGWIAEGDGPNMVTMCAPP